MHFRNGAGNLHGFHHLVVGNRAHTHDHVSAHAACGRACDVCQVHGNVAPHGVVALLNACFDKLAFKAKAAANNETYQVIAPISGYIRCLFHQVAVFVNAISREVGCYIAVGGAKRCLARSDFGDFQ